MTSGDSSRSAIQVTGGQALTAEERSPLSGSRQLLNMQLTPVAASRSSNTPPLRGAGTCTVSRV